MESNDELKLIQKFLYQMSNDSLSSKDYQMLQYLIIKNERFFRNCYPLMRTSITGEKIMYISDTHIGGLDEVPASLDLAYNTALSQNIKTVIHAGDLIEACANNQFDKSLNIVREELDRALDLIPNELITKLLLGNHDYSAIRTYPSIVSQFFCYPKLEILGMQKVLLDWDNIATIRLNHSIKQLQCIDEEETGIIQVSGHYHAYSFEQTSHDLQLPPICKDNIDYQKEQLSEYGMTLSTDSKPSFVISSKQDENTILFELYCINRENHRLEQSTEKVEVNVKTKQIKKY